MTISKPRGRNGARQVFVYHPLEKRKIYVGSRVKLRGTGGAQELEREKAEEFAKAAERERILDGQRAALQQAALAGVYTVDTWSDEWLEEHHGPDTKRPEPGSRKTNESNLKYFRKEFGHRPLTGDGSVGRKEALAWARKRQWAAKTVAAMYADAIDLEIADYNPMANRQLPGRRERKFIKAITEQETDRLAEIALDEWGRDGYGLVARALVLFGAWVGARPGETLTTPLANMNFDDGLVDITRVKKRGGRYPTDTVVLPEIAIDALKDAMPHLATEGPAFRTIDGSPFAKGNLGYYWRPIRARFKETVAPDRWEELLDGSEAGKYFDFYTLRHRAGSHIVKMGGDQFDASHQLGNSPQVCLETYIHQDSDHRNERNRGFLVSSKIVDLDARRERKGA